MRADRRVEQALASSGFTVRSFNALLLRSCSSATTPLVFHEDAPLQTLFGTLKKYSLRKDCVIIGVLTFFPHLIFARLFL
jgi:hypothetical protein